MQIPGGSVGVAFAPDGKRAYVSGIQSQGAQPPDAKGVGGDVIHVYNVKPAAGTATELDPIALPDARDGAAAQDNLPPSTNVKAFPIGLAVSPDGKRLVVALGQADQVAIVNLGNGQSSLANVGRYPFGVAIGRDSDRAYVTNERDGTVSVLSLPAGETVATIDVSGGGTFAGYPHPEGLVTDPTRDRLYVAVTDRDLVAVIDTKSNKVDRFLQVGRPDAAIGSAPVNVGVAPDGDTLYVALAGEDAILGIALTRRKNATEIKPRGDYVERRSVKKIAKFRKKVRKADRKRDKRIARKPDSRKAANATYRAKVKKLRPKLLFGTKTKACGGPSKAQDRKYGREVLKAFDRLTRALAKARKLPPKKSKAAVKRAIEKFKNAVKRAEGRLPKITDCPAEGEIPGTPAFATIGRLPTAAYPVDVEISPNGKRMVWLSAKGLGTGPNPNNESIKELTKGRAGVLARPTDQELAALNARANAAVMPTNAMAPPAGTPVVGPNGGPSQQIKYVFYIVRENRTYDQIFGANPVGEGDPNLQLFGDNGDPGPTGGITPNAHALSREFNLLDNVYANSEESSVGHKITAGGYANDYQQRKYQADGRGKVGEPDIFPIGTPPNAFIFDQAVRQNVGFRVYGELGAANQPFGNDGRPTYPAVLANTDFAYPSQIQGTCRPSIPVPPGTPNEARCTADSGTLGATTGPPTLSSRFRSFQQQFNSQLATGTVPAFNYLILFNDHTDGTTPGVYTPRANIADNDLALGQVVQLISQSPIWEQSAIFVVEDDSQDGADHIDAHRMPAFVISPWAKSGGQVISTRFDHYSFLKTIELILGLDPLSINDALATPLYDAFVSGGQGPDVNGTRYTAIQPQVSMTETNPATAANARLSAAMPYDQVDRVPQRIGDKILWQSIYGPDSRPPPPGPNYSPIERARAVESIELYRDGKLNAMYKYLTAGEEGEDEGRLEVTARLLGAGLGVDEATAMAQIEGESLEEELAEAEEELEEARGE